MAARRSSATPEAGDGGRDGPGPGLAAILRLSIDRPAGAWLATALVLVLCGAAAAGLAPLGLKVFVDGLAQGAGANAPLRLAAPLGAYVGALLLQRVCEQAQAYAFGRGEQRLIRRFGAESFAHLLALPIGFHLDARSGALVRSLTEGVAGLRLALTQLVLTVLPLAAQLVVVAFVIGAVLGPELAAILAAAACAYALVFAFGAVRMRPPMAAISNSNLDAGATAADSLMNVETIKAFVAEARFTERYDAVLSQTEQAWRGFLARRAENGISVALVFGLAFAGALSVAAQRVSGGSLTIGGFVLLNAYILQMIRPLEMLGFAVRDIGQGLAYLASLRATLALTPELSHAGSGGPEAEAAGPAELVFEQVSFGYATHGATLRDVSFRVAPGTKVGIVGASGAGKSSLLRLILRFFEPSAGRILWDGRPIGDIPLKTLRRQIALVSQDTILFNDTIGGNIAVAAQATDPAALLAAADAAGLTPLLERLPTGFQTQVGERGLKLSGGERQRVSVARAALKAARLIVLDEATAALDPATEREVWASLDEVSRGATTLIVTHRLAAVAEAEEILVLDQGRIAEQGTFPELMARDGVFARLWRLQDPTRETVAAGPARSPGRPPRAVETPEPADGPGTRR